MLCKKLRKVSRNINLCRDFALLVFERGSVEQTDFAKYADFF
jgi:hypothetical protein